MRAFISGLMKCKFKWKKKREIKSSYIVFPDSFASFEIYLKTHISDVKLNEILIFSIILYIEKAPGVSPCTPGISLIINRKGKPPMLL